MRSLLAIAAAALCAAPRAAAAAPCGPNTSTQSVVQAQGTDLNGKLVVITGGDSGIGYQTALALAGANASLVILSYDAAGSGRSAADNITRLTSNAAVEVQQLDLSSFDSVRAGAAAVLEKHSAIDFLVCDAGIASAHGLPPMTDDGFERVMQVNYLGHFLLIDLLLPALRRSGAGRVLLFSSTSASKSTCPGGVLSKEKGCTDLARLQELVRTPPKGTPPKDTGNYGPSKFMIVYLARERAVRETGPVSFYSIRPGLVDGTSMSDGTFTAAEKAVLCRVVFSGVTPCPIPLENGGATPAYLVAAPSLPSDDNGKEFMFCGTVPPPTGEENGGEAWDAATQAQLFDLSRNWTAA